MLRPYLLSSTSLLVLVPVVNAQSPESAKPNSTSTTAPAQVVSDTGLPCGDCAVDRHGPWSQVWASFGYARWTMRDAPYAYPLASTSVGVSNNPGAVGDPNTVILFGDQPLDLGWFNGFRVDGGVWFNDCHTAGVGFGLTSFGTKTFNTLFDSNTSGPSFISRPIYDAQTPGPVGLIVSDPDANISGSLGIENKAQFYGFDLHIRQNFMNNETYTIDGTLGFRYFNLSEQLLITQRSQYNPVEIPEPQVAALSSSPLIVNHIEVDSLQIADSFATRNQVFGVQLGTRAEARWGAFFTSFAGKVTLGVNEERIEVNGYTSGVTRDGATITAPGGVLAVGGYSPPDAQGHSMFVGTTGVQRYNQFVIMPEFSFQVGMQVTSHVRLFAGYDWLYINDVVRPGNQIDPVINQRYVPASPAYGTLAGPNKPSYPMNHTDFVAQGFSVGLEFQY